MKDLLSGRFVPSLGNAGDGSHEQRFLGFGASIADVFALDQPEKL
jgi:hypothetical protein